VEQSARTELDRWMTRLADGDRKAFDPVFEALWPVVRAFCARAVGTGDAEDAAQAALVRVFARAGEYDPARPALPWALAIAAWECRTVRRRHERRREEPLVVVADGALATAVAHIPSPEEAAIDADLRAAALAALGTLRPLDIETITAAWSGSEARGAKLRKRLSRALHRLRVAWRSRHGDG
jgi:RNA polymerase sigma-70 factor (ECF subfamily)